MKRQSDKQQATSNGSHNSMAQCQQYSLMAVHIECGSNSVVVSWQWHQQECSSGAILKTFSKKQ